jgi:hypothetical protein
VIDKPRQAIAFFHAPKRLSTLHSVASRRCERDAHRDAGVVPDYVP